MHTNTIPFSILIPYINIPFPDYFVSPYKSLRYCNYYLVVSIKQATKVNAKLYTSSIRRISRIVQSNEEQRY